MNPETVEKLALQIAGTFDTAVKIGLGATLAMLADRWKRGDERRSEARRRRRERIIDPIVSFVDDLLMSISETHWLTTEQAIASAGTDKEKVEKQAMDALSARMVSIRNREATIEARVGSLASAALAQVFQELSGQLIQVRRMAEREGFGAAREEARKAADLGAKFFAVLTSVEERDPPKEPTAMTGGGRRVATLDKSDTPKHLR